MILRPYQTDVVDRLRQLLAGLPAGQRWAILQAATGAGKTVIASYLISCLVAKGKRCLFLAPSRELVKQCSDKLTRFGVPHGIIMAGRPYNLQHLVQVASKDTLLSRVEKVPAKIKQLESMIEGGLRMDHMAQATRALVRLNQLAIELPEFDLIIPDECHLTGAPTWMALLQRWPAAVVVGLTATPARGGGKALVGYRAMVSAAPTSKLIEDGFLVSTKVFAPYRPDLKGVKVNKDTGEYMQKPLEKAMNKPELVGDIVEHWKRLADGKMTIVFASGIGHSLAIRDQYRAAGVSAEHIDGGTDTMERDAIVERFKAREITVLCNCNVFTAGVDIPEVECIQLAKPTQSFVAFMQMIGRGVRPCQGKTCAILLDHAGCVYFFQHMPDWDFDWKLKQGETIADKLKSPRPGVVHCPKCHALFTGGLCPNCGHTAKVEPVMASNADSQSGQLVEIGEELPAAQEHEKQVRFWHVCLGTQANKGRTCGAAAGMFKGKMGVYPWQVDGLPNCPPQGAQWKLPVGQVYPQYLAENRKKKSKT